MHDNDDDANRCEKKSRRHDDLVVTINALPLAWHKAPYLYYTSTTNYLCHQMWNFDEGTELMGCIKV